MTKPPTCQLPALLAGVLALLALDAAPVRASELSDGFSSPPQSARPRVWWHWMNGNITKEGIKLDFEWMKRVGIGGVQNFDANLFTPQMVDKRLQFMTPEWRDAFHYAADLASTMGLEMAIASSPGWSETGGPWVTPERAMKKFVWSETLASAGELPRLKAPPTSAGPFQNVSTADTEGKAANFYADTTVIAYKLPADALADVEARQPTLSASAAVEVQGLVDGDVGRLISLPYDRDGKAWIRLDYPSPHRIQSATVAMPGGRTFGAPPAARVWLEAMNDEGTYRRVVEFPAGAAQTRSVTFTPVQAKSFRISFEAVPGARLGQDPGAAGAIGMPFPPLPTAFAISEVTLRQEARVNHFDEKAGFGAAVDYYAIATPSVGVGSVVRPADVVDLTSKLRADGTLDWTVPAGRWAILRFGYTLTGHTNGPASPEATGLEVDKLNAAYVRDYLNHYLDMYVGAAGPGLLGSKGVTALLNDSIESGPQNWTDNMLADFRRLRGYDFTPWMPVLTGVIIKDAASTDRALWDFRRTIAELISESHYHTIAQVAKERGLTLYGEALENRRPQLGDDLAMRRYTTIPMAAMWVNPANAVARNNYWADDVGAASVAHVYGQNITAAESLTSATMPWYHTPRDLKSTADLEFAYGINRPVIHTSVHQPLIGKRPGLALAVQLGQYFNRNETWADMADGWVTYLTRSSYLLQQGHFAADVAYFIGEEGPMTALFVDGPPADLPRHYGVDFVNADMLGGSIEVRDGKLVTPSGMSYRVLYLGGSSRKMTLTTLKRLESLVRSGATVIGEQPTDTPSGADDIKAFHALAKSLWKDAHQRAGARIGAGRIMAGVTSEDALHRLSVPYDFDYANRSDILTVHRHLEDGDVYYVNSRSGQPIDVEAAFHVTGFAPELWRADTGERLPLGYRQDGTLTHVRLRLAPNDAVFVVFQQRTTAKTRLETQSAERVIDTLAGDWTLTFERGLGAPEQPQSLTAFNRWNESTDARVRYFSGVGTYRRTLNVPAEALSSSARIWLDLGEVDDLAEVWVNGQRAGVAWHAPYRVDLTAAVRAGANQLEIRVANRWVNRLIGDAQPGATKVTTTQGPAYEASAPLVPAGLTGPVRLVSRSAPVGE